MVELLGIGSFLRNGLLVDKYGDNKEVIEGKEEIIKSMMNMDYYSTNLEDEVNIEN